MSRRADPTVVGAFVVGALVLVVAGVLVFGGGAVLSDRFSLVAFFSGNVRGLQEGSAVEFRGVRVGTVTRIRLLLDADSNALLIPVHMELDPRRLALTGAADGEVKGDTVQFFDDLVAKGLRARLELRSFVTGQLAVGLDMHPDSTVRRLGIVSGVYEMPTVPSTLDRVAEVVQELPLQDMAGKLIQTLDSVERMLNGEQLSEALDNAADAAADTRRLVAGLLESLGPTVEETRAVLRETREGLADIARRADATLEEYTRLARDAGSRIDALAVGLERALEELGGIRASLDARIAPVAQSAVGTLDEARGALADTRALLAADSRTRYNLDVTLEELAAAARSLRIMVDYLEQNPDAIIRGKDR